MNINKSDISGTDKNGVPIRGNPPTFFGLGLIAYLDILGFSKAVLQQWSDGENSPFFRLLRIKSSLPTLAENRVTITSCTPSSSSNSEVINSHYLPMLHTVSDSIMMSIALPPENPLIDFEMTYASIMINLRFIWQSAIEEGFVIRGALEIGDIYWSPTEIIGPALIEAYRLESKIAKTARVIIGPRLLKILSGVDNKMQDFFLSILIKCNDGLVAWSPLNNLTEVLLEKVRKISLQCMENRDREKYAELLYIYENNTCLNVPSMDDVRKGEEILLKCLQERD